MTPPIPHEADSKLDLLLERAVDLPPALIWQAWTTPERLKKWFTPAPWQTIDCEIDLRPGGIFRTVMRSPEGQEFPNLGCYLEIVENRKLVWTNALAPGYRPVPPAAALPCEEFTFTAVLTLSPEGSGTNYSALVLHGDESARNRHETMGFYDGWSTALDQLIASVEAERAA